MVTQKEMNPRGREGTPYCPALLVGIHEDWTFADIAKHSAWERTPAVIRKPSHAKTVERKCTGTRYGPRRQFESVFMLR